MKPHWAKQIEGDEDTETTTGQGQGQGNSPINPNSGGGVPGTPKQAPDGD